MIFLKITEPAGFMTTVPPLVSTYRGVFFVLLVEVLEKFYHCNESYENKTVMATSLQTTVLQDLLNIL